MVAPSTPNPPQYSKGLVKCFYCRITGKREAFEHDSLKNEYCCANTQWCVAEQKRNSDTRNMDHELALPMDREWLEKRMSAAEQIARLQGIPYVRGGG